MKHLIALLFVASAIAQTNSTVAIVDTLPAGGGSCTLTWSRLSSTGAYIDGSSAQYTNGALSLSLVPNVDGSYYRASIFCPQGSPINQTQIWTVPDVATTVDLATIKIPPIQVFSPYFIQRMGASDGQVLTYVATAGAWLPRPGSGGGATPGGSSGNLQVNGAGAFGGLAGSSFSGANLTLGGTLTLVSHYLCSTDGGCNIGATAANRVGTINATGNIASAAVVIGSSMQVSGGNPYVFNTRSRLYSPADGQILLTNAAATDFNRLQFGGSTSSFPALVRSNTQLISRLADDSADAPMRTGDLTHSMAVQHKTGSYTITAAEKGTYYDNAAASGSVPLTLPATTAGLNYWACVKAGQTLQLTAPAGSVIQIPGSASTSGGNLSSSTVGSCAFLLAIDSTTWQAFTWGTWATN